MKNKFFAAITSLLLTCVMCGICSVNVASASLASDSRYGCNMSVYYFADSAPTLCEDYLYGRFGPHDGVAFDIIYDVQYEMNQSIFYGSLNGNYFDDLPVNSVLIFEINRFAVDPLQVASALNNLKSTKNIHIIWLYPENFQSYYENNFIPIVEQYYGEGGAVDLFRMTLGDRRGMFFNNVIDTLSGRTWLRGNGPQAAELNNTVFLMDNSFCGEKIFDEDEILSMLDPGDLLHIYDEYSSISMFLYRLLEQLNIASWINQHPLEEIMRRLAVNYNIHILVLNSGEAFNYCSCGYENGMHYIDLNFYNSNWGTSEVCLRDYDDFVLHFGNNTKVAALTCSDTSENFYNNIFSLLNLSTDSSIGGNGSSSCNCYIFSLHSLKTTRSFLPIWQNTSGLYFDDELFFAFCAEEDVPRYRDDITLYDINDTLIELGINIR